MKWLVFSLLFSLSSTVFAAPMLPLLTPKESDDNFHQAYSYAIAPMNRANWIYLGFAPRATDPARVSIHLSKVGFTMRITLEMTEQEVASYPQNLVRRAQRVNEIMQQRALTLTQPSLGDRYFAQIAQVQQRSQVDYKNGLAWLKKFFPNNIFEVSNQGSIRVVAHFVSPITTLRYGPHKPADGVYTTYSLEERKDFHRDLDTGKTDFIFGGFPALWFNGQIGIHGPIRFSNTGERDRSGRPIEQLWAENEIGNFAYNKAEGITPKYRWDLVRTRDSAGCIRAESMEIRHILPAYEASLKQVPIYVSSQWDQVTLPGKAPAYVNVNYYIISPYLPPLTQEQWLQKEAPSMLSLQNQMLTFPYLDPATVEFYNSTGAADYQSMLQLNQAE